MKPHALRQIATCALALAACQLTASADLAADFAAEFANSGTPQIKAKVRTGAPGTAAKVFSFTNKKKNTTVFNFKIPRGNTGAAGPQGPSRPSKVLKALKAPAAR